ncbi:excinuclease ABC subunit UvrC [Planktothrix paucivesiculata]|uniref:UvrABC system protein C n=1 Tax=Planktothrix paucivesiculata PCC 9631 TaxID=671071 RepID=A0A7Z9BPQ2_9CYAN|nr:excinuclease ABC subunit UvrC [Planktothrix paucivesiculata]VXD14559.1 UvrABC system protein C [Planktothrix paucivesiculata PCC 9631]
MSLIAAFPLVKDPERLEKQLRDIPPVPGVYLMRDGQDNILYIGKSKKLRSRVRSYFREQHDHTPRIYLMVQQITEIEFIVTDTEAEALALEANLVKQHQPHFNVLLKDDKKYPYLCITWSEDYPRIFITRKRRLGNIKDRYYGPYVDTRVLRNTLHLTQRIFPLRQRRKPLFKDRPCLNYDIGRCPGVCQLLISPEEYRKIVQKVAMIFQGRSDELIDHLTEQMEQASEVLNFEMAGIIRDQIQELQSLNADQKVSLPDDRVSRDAIALAANSKQSCVQLFQIRAGKLVGRLGFTAQVPPELKSTEMGLILQRVLEEHYQSVDPVEIPNEILVQYELPDESILTDWLSDRKGKKVTILTPQRQVKAELIQMVERNAEYELERVQKLSDRDTAALEDLAAILDLPDLPHRIEGYDISHIQGSDAVASRVVFIQGLAAPQYYRHYKIKNPTVHAGHSDDFASLAEVIERRCRDYQTSTDKPDLIMIDGGKGQLSAVVAVLEKLNLLEEIRVVSLAKQREEIFLPGESFPLETDGEQPGVQLLRRLRDEAHRFAVSFHRNQRTQRMKRSYLDDIPGLGHHRQKLLLAHFRSLEYIRIATPEQLGEVSGIGPKLAQEIYNYFH